jgi:alpha-glucosidase
VRHLFLHYPYDPNVRDLRYQFLLGPDFLVAPVLDKGVTRLRVYLPAGEWTHLWSGAVTVSAAGEWVEIAAPLGRPGVFFRSGAESGMQLSAALKAAHLL